MQHKIKEEFNKRYGQEGVLYAAPGRINLIGEHTDYNEGYVMPGAIDKSIVACIKPNGTKKVNVYSMDMGEETSFGLEEKDMPSQQWARYIFGVAREIEKRGGKVEGFDAVFAGNIPLGAGLSSSAALESCFAFALNDIFNDNKIEPMELAKIGQSTEHNYCGVKCGIMDQFASVLGKENCLLRLDWGTMEYEAFPFNPKGYKVVLIDSKVKHELVGSPYNKRRESCERVAKALNLPSLRNATFENLEKIKNEISDEDYHRAKYVIGERERVLAVCEALKKDDYDTVGKMMYLTHEGLSKDYEVSCVELDNLNDWAREAGVTGSRIMGGGFGGCTINLVEEAKYRNFIDTVSKKFNAKYGHNPAIYDVIISQGAHKTEE